MKTYEKLEYFQECFHRICAIEVLKTRGENIDDWSIETHCFGVDLSDYCLSVQDMMYIVKYNIPKTIVFERYDMYIASYYSDRIREEIAKNPDFKKTNLYRFNKKFNGN